MAVAAGATSYSVLLSIVIGLALVTVGVVGAAAREQSENVARSVYPPHARRATSSTPGP